MSEFNTDQQSKLSELNKVTQLKAFNTKFKQTPSGTNFYFYLSTWPGTIKVVKEKKSKFYLLLLPSRGHLQQFSAVVLGVAACLVQYKGETAGSQTNDSEKRADFMFPIILGSSSACSGAEAVVFQVEWF